MSNSPLIEYRTANAFDGVQLPFAVAHTTPSRRTNSIASGMIVAALFVVAAGVALGSAGSTYSVYNDTESALANVFGAGSLNFVAGQTPQVLDIIPDGTPVTIPATVTAAAGSATTSVRLTMQTTGGTAALCDALQATVNAPFVYTGPLSGLTGVMQPDQSVTVALTLPSLVPDTPEHAQCLFDLVFKGWDARAPEGTGYTDEERIAITVIDPPLPTPPSATAVVTPDVPPVVNDAATTPDAPPEAPVPTPDTPTPPTE